MENAAAVPYVVCEGFQGKQHTMTVAIDPEDAYIHQGPLQAASGPARALLSPVDCRSTPGEDNGDAA